MLGTDIKSTILSFMALTLAVGTADVLSGGDCSANEQQFKHLLETIREVISTEMNRAFFFHLAVAIIACSITILAVFIYDRKNEGKNRQQSPVHLRVSINEIEIEIDFSHHNQPDAISISERDMSSHASVSNSYRDNTSNHTMASNNGRDSSHLSDATAVPIHEGDISNRYNNNTDDTDSLSRSNQTYVSFFDEGSVSNRSNYSAASASVDRDRPHRNAVSMSGRDISNHSNPSIDDDIDTPHRSNRTSISMSERDISFHSGLSLYDDTETPNHSNRNFVPMNGRDISNHSGQSSHNDDNRDISNRSTGTVESSIYDDDSSSIQPDPIPYAEAVVVAEAAPTMPMAGGETTDPQ